MYIIKVEQDYSADPRVEQCIADPRVVQDYSADQGSCKTHIVILVQTQGSRDSYLMSTGKGYIGKSLYRVYHKGYAGL